MQDAKIKKKITGKSSAMDEKINEKINKRTIQKTHTIQKKNQTHTDEFVLEQNSLSFYFFVFAQYLFSLEKHVEKLANDWVIEENTRLKHLNKIKKILNELDDLIYDKTNVASEENYSPELLYQIVYMDNLLNNTMNTNFAHIREDILELSGAIGAASMSKFLQFWFGPFFLSLFTTEEQHFLSGNDVRWIDVFDPIYVPYKVIISPYCHSGTSEKIKNPQILKTKSKCDFLINNTCKIILPMKKTNTIITFFGYIDCRSNAYINYNPSIIKYLAEKKMSIISKFNENENKFVKKYLSYCHTNVLFAYSVEQLQMFIKNLYPKYKFLTLTGDFNQIIKQFAASSIKEMFTSIELLLMGNDNDNLTAVSLFSMLEDKRINAESINKVIYANLSLPLQNKLIPKRKQYSNELSKLKKFDTDKIPIERRLATLPDMPQEVKKYILEKEKEMKTGDNTHKANMAINGLISFPWKPSKQDEFDIVGQSAEKSIKYLKKVQTNLDRNIYGHEESKKTLIELVGKWVKNPNANGQVIGLVGPPGVGKTLLAKSISDALKIPFAIVGLGGMNDSADLIGHSYTYAGAQYGLIVRQMIKCAKWRCVLLFDEVDKVAKRNDTNEIFSTLIHLTDPNTNQHFQDRFYSTSIDFDISGALIVFSYNDSRKLDRILLDRIKEIRVGPYSIVEKIKIAQTHMIPELCQSIGIDKNKIIFSEKIIRYIIENYTLEPGVRELKRKLEQIMLKINIDRIYLRGPFADIIKENNLENKPEIINDLFTMKYNFQITINNEMLKMYLNKAIVSPEEIHTYDTIGVVNGLYATDLGLGGIISIQVYENLLRNDNHEKIKITGNQKNVMKESVMCAFTAVTNILTNKKNINQQFPNGFHVHATDGATTKDGPSAGCAFAVAFASLILQKKINRYIAMTGEIDLTGKIKKIGGLTEKLMGAKKAGVRIVYISNENIDDYCQIKDKQPELFNELFQVVVVDHLIDLLTDKRIFNDIDLADFEYPQ